MTNIKYNYTSLYVNGYLYVNLLGYLRLSIELDVIVTAFEKLSNSLTEATGTQKVTGVTFRGVPQNFLQASQVERPSCL
jgi:hypothetical protein